MSFLGKCVTVPWKSQQSSKTGTEQEVSLKTNTEALWECAHMERTKETVCTAQFVLFVQRTYNVQDVLTETKGAWSQHLCFRLDFCFTVSHMLPMFKGHNYSLVYSTELAWSCFVEHMCLCVYAKDFFLSTEGTLHRTQQHGMDERKVRRSTWNRENRSGGALPVCRVVFVPFVTALDHLHLPPPRVSHHLCLFGLLSFRWSNCFTTE